MADKKRIEWVDIIKYICIMGVITSHLESNTDMIYALYSPFYLTGFLFASGYVYRHKDDFKTFFLKKVRTLFWPWLFFSVSNILLSQVLTFNEHGSLSEELMWNFLQIREKGDGIWFVAALFVAFIPFYFVIGAYSKRAEKRNSVVFLLLVSGALLVVSIVYGEVMDPQLLPWKSFALPWHLEYIFIAMFWMVLGYLFKERFEAVFESKCNAPVKILIIVAYLVLACLLPGLTRKMPVVPAYILTYVTSLLGILALVIISKLIKSNKYMLYIGGNTLLCFALHGKVYSVIQHLLKRLVGSVYASILADKWASSAFAVFLAILISLILIIPIYIINRWLPFLIGKKSFGSASSAQQVK